MKFKFSLKWLLGLILLAAFAMWWGTQLGTTVATFEIAEANLTTEESGLVSGDIICRYTRREPNGTTIYDDLLFTVYRVDNRRLNNDLQGQKFKIRFRLHDIWFFEKENPHRKFAKTVLDIEDDEFVGYVNMVGWTEIVIGHRDDL